MQMAALICAEWKYMWVFQKRYFLNFICGLISLFLFLVFLQFGISSLQEGSFTQVSSSKISILIVGFFVFNMISSAIGSISNIISEGTSTGTLEQTMLSPFGTTTVFLCKASVSSTFSFLFYIVVIPLSMLVCRHFFWVNIFTLFLYVIPLWLASWGVGFAIGASTIIYKQTSSFMGLIQFIVLSLLVIPSYPFNSYSLLPIAPQAMTINKVFASGITVSGEWLMFLYLQGMIYLILGIAVYKIGEQFARDKGTLGQY